jgi:hypothetical protein
MKRTLISILLIPIVSYAGWFGPSNFQDCILEGMKGVTSNHAASMITVACRQKFPHVPTESQKQAAKEPVKRSGFTRVDLWDGNSGVNIVNKASWGSWSGRSLSITNKNSFMLEGIYMGIPLQQGSEKLCPTTMDGYREIHLCLGHVGTNFEVDPGVRTDLKVV